MAHVSNNVRGFDMMAVTVRGTGTPRGLSAAVASALLKRADVGGSCQVRVSLSRMQAQEVGLLSPEALGSSPLGWDVTGA